LIFLEYYDWKYSEVKLSIVVDRFTLEENFSDNRASNEPMNHNNNNNNNNNNISHKGPNSESRSWEQIVSGKLILGKRKRNTKRYTDI
jgi:hypothetical protein